MQSVYIMPATYDDHRGDFWAKLRLGNELYRLSYSMDASPQSRLVISDSQGKVLQCDIEEYAMRSHGGTWESWRLRAPIGVLECHVIWSSAKSEPSPLQQILGCTEPVVVSSGELFVVRVVSSQPVPAEQPIPLQREAVPAGDWGVVRAYLQAHGEATYRELLDALSAAGQRMTERALQARIKRWEHRGRVVIERRGFPAVAIVKLAKMQSTHSDQSQPAFVGTHKAAKPSGASFLSRYTDEQLQLVGLTRHFLMRVYQIVREARTITSAEIARELALPKASYRMGMALSILVQERFIYELSHHRYSIAPPNYQPAPEVVLLKTISAVCDNPGSILADLVRATGISSGVLSKVTRYLAAEGFIRRELVAENIGVGVRGVWRHYPAQ